MNETSCLLPHRGVVVLSGADRIKFLQGLVSNDVTRAASEQAVYAALLTPQGRFLHDMFILAGDEALWLDCESARADDLIARLDKYKLRSDVTLENRTVDYGVAAVPRGQGMPGAYPDPRLPDLGGRMVAPRAALPRENAADFAAYERLRLAHGIPDGSRDIQPGDMLLLEANFDCLNGVDFGKGCYMGQELTARTHYRGLVKKRLFPVCAESGDCPPSGTALYADGQEIGTMRSSQGDLGLALLKTAALKTGATITGGAARLHARKPDWMPDAVTALGAE